MIARNFCTYFDHRYLPRGLALRESLVLHAPGHTLWVLCLSRECEELLKTANLHGVRLVPLRELEAFDPELAAARSNRSLVEYYFTCSPCFPRYLLARQPEMESITYLDSDLFLFSDLGQVFEEIGEAQVAITPHRFPADRSATMERYGRYNVGWLTFRRGPAALACLEWWRERCIEWCYDRLEGDRFADQKYLDRFEELFGSVHVIANRGANLAPWNLAGTRLQGPPTTVDGAALAFFHFHGLKRVAPGLYDTNLADYKISLSEPVARLIYRPYLSALMAAERFSEELGAADIRGEPLRIEHSMYARFLRAFGMLRSAMRGNMIRMG